MKATEKQIALIVYLIKNNTQSETIEKILQSIPKNSEKYPDTRADYSGQILADRLSVISIQQASWIINCLQHKKNLQKLIKTLRLLGIISPIDDKYNAK